MDPNDDEERLLRSVVLQNAQSILFARQRAEEELVRAKEALELKTQELARSLAMMRATLESTTDGILATDGGGRVTGFSDKFVQMWQLPREIMDLGDHQQIAEVISRNFKEPQQFLARIEDIYRTSPPESYDLLELADGRVFERFSRIQFVEERNVGRVWSLRDITEAQRAEASLRESEQRFRVLFETGPVAVFSCDREGILQNYNRRAAELWGREPKCGDISARYCGSLKLFHPDGRLLPHTESPIIRVLRAGITVKDAEVFIERPDGSRISVLVAFAPLKTEQGEITGAITAFYDITERKRMENELRQVAADLSEADHRKDEFLAMLAHELRNPLAPIRNALQIVQLSAGNAEAVQSASEMMDRQIRHMVRLVDDLLDVSRISRGKIDLRRERVELASIIHQVVESSRPAIESGQHQLAVSLPSQPVYLNADAVRLAQVFSNLLNNASKYSEPGGRIELVVSDEGEEERGENEVSDLTTRHSPLVTIRVKDTGVGIPPDMLPKIFEMFTQVDTSLERSHGGLGIGLTLVQRLVELHGGSVSAHSEGPGRGSEFVVRLPILIETPKVSNSSGPAASKPTAAISRRILVVDDNRDSATTLAMLLELTGNETHTAHDGLAAVEAAATFKPEVVLLDIGLPKLNGYEAACQIREQPWGKKMVLVALTGWGQEEDRRKSYEAGFDGHMVKPVDLADLTKLLAELLPTIAHQPEA